MDRGLTGSGCRLDVDRGCGEGYSSFRNAFLFNNLKIQQFEMIHKINDG